MKDKLFLFIWIMIIVSSTIALVACDQAKEPGNGSQLPDQPDVILATTTSTQDSGLLDFLVPLFQEESGYIVKVIAVGTGQALKMGEEGNADVLLVHAPAAEKVLIDNGSAIDRQLIMHNDFVVVGPAADPAGIRGISTPVTALKQIAQAQSNFVSRGDDSGTHKKELALWSTSGLTPEGDWYLQSGQGMGATLIISSEKQGYTLTDRATYLAQQDALDLEILVEGDPSLLNVYHAMLVNPEMWPKVNEAGARSWIDFLTRADIQLLIGEFGIEKFGQPLFFADANKSDSDLGLE
jgi:tungstate transport system substrate-binding protein